MNTDVSNNTESAVRPGTKTRIPAYQKIGLTLGPAVFVLMALMEPVSNVGSVAWLTAAVTVWIAIWWATEAVPIPITALLPLVLFPLLNIESATVIAKSYSSSVVYLLIGGFILALGIQRWGLHRRVALYILCRVGSSPSTVVGGFMLVTALLSMWVSNTATTLMMIPIATSVAMTLAPNQNNVQHRHFMVVLLLAVAYAASIGGLGTLVGTPPNLLMAGFLREHHGININFVDWMLFGIPLVLVMLPAAWLVLTRLAFPFGRLSSDGQRIKESIAEHYQALGEISAAEKRIAWVFMGVVTFWILRQWIISITGLNGLSDTSIAICGAILLFILPSGEDKPLMDWSYAKQLPWDVVLLYGGGMALATAITNSGLAQTLGHALEGFSNMHLLGLMFVVTALVLLLTELTNNSATVATFMPILGILAIATDHHPLQLAAPAAMAASCAFMLPVATPPNAIVYGSGRVTLPQMARAGVLINILGLVLIPLIAYSLLPLLF
jgi:solute carrier family 13 (sodium-dependent dicarboxylate transporter), member 2/3/5